RRPRLKDFQPRQRLTQSRFPTQHVSSHALFFRENRIVFRSLPGRARRYQKNPGPHALVHHRHEVKSSTHSPEGRHTPSIHAKDKDASPKLGSGKGNKPELFPAYGVCVHQRAKSAGCDSTRERVTSPRTSNPSSVEDPVWMIAAARLQWSALLWQRRTSEAQ